MDRSFANGEQLAAAMEAAAARMAPTIRSTNQHEATLLKALIQLHATGRPGPNVITGRYRASWRAVSKAIGGGGETIVGTEAPQGRRLEFGFVGPDSLGRVYNQDPFPHVQPALAVFQRTYSGQILRAVVEAL